MFDTVIFDLDGVIIDSKPVMEIAFTQSFREVVGKDGRPPFEEFIKHSGRSLKDIFSKLGLPVEKMVLRYRELSIANIDKILLFKDILGIIKKLKEKRFKLAIVTGKERDRTIQILKKLEIYKYFESIVSSSDVSNPKPHPEGMIKALEALNSVPERSISIGDSTNDITASKKAGIKSIAVTWGMLSEEDLIRENPDYLINEPEEILNIINI